MTKNKKVLWHIAGAVPGAAFAMPLFVFQPLNYYGVVREQFGQTIWIVLLTLSFLAIVPLYLWYSYCYARAKEQIPSGRQGVREHLRKERVASLILLGVCLLLSIAAVLYNTL